jgi:hypothetical protein
VREDIICHDLQAHDLPVLPLKLKDVKRWVGDIW